MGLLDLLKLGGSVKKLNLLLDELRELVALAKPVVVKVHRIADIILDENDNDSNEENEQ